MPQLAQQRVVLHLGFHKTATTKIQAVLQENSAKIERAGSYVIPHQKVRNKYMKCVEVVANRSIGMDFAPKLDEGELKHHANKVFANGPVKKFERIVMSEENAFGHVGQCVFPGTLYRFPKNYVWTFKDLLPVPVEEVHVAVRSYDRFFSSCYTEFLGSVKGPRYITGEMMAAKIMAHPPNWFALVEMLTEVFSKHKIHVWVFEEFRTQLPQLISQLAGCKISDNDINARERLRGSPGAVAVRNFEQIKQDAGITQALEYWKNDSRDAEADAARNTAYDPWTDKQRSHLQRLYAQDLDRIGQLKNVVVHR